MCKFVRRIIMHTKVFFDCITVNISDEDCKYLCEHRFFSEDPTDEDIRVEFVTGTGITPNKPELWNQADKMFADYVNDLRQVSVHTLSGD